MGGGTCAEKVDGQRNVRPRSGTRVRAGMLCKVSPQYISTVTATQPLVSKRAVSSQQVLSSESRPLPWQRVPMSVGASAHAETHLRGPVAVAACPNERGCVCPRRNPSTRPRCRGSVSQ
eukprot:358143-Chlamydomonas_euryale.AAC.1